MKKNIVLALITLAMFMNPFSTVAESGDETKVKDDTAHTEDNASEDDESEPEDSESKDDESEPEDNESQEDDQPQEEENKTHTLTFLGFDGEVIQTIEVKEDEKIDYSQIDVSGLHTFVNKYTEQDFSEWSSTPEYISEDTTIQALWKRGIISADGKPVKTEYYSKGADIDLNGLSIIITLETQTTKTDNDGNFIVEKQENNITGSCYTEKLLEELFETDKTAIVDVIPYGDDKPIFSYEITLFDSLGDTNNDNVIDAIDSSFILETYADFSTGANNSLTDQQKKICDINQDGKIDAMDATYILMYYAESSTGGNPVWENMIENSEQ
ncbi:MAG: hypothetical protein K2J39_08430 [Ruminococcus sp.]|nr:hypothetical protein [Ruminococcus sp.]